MRYLVDANVLSEPTKPAPDRRVIEWLRQNEREIAVDPIILGEVRFGILLLPGGRSAPGSSGGSTRALRDFTVCRGKRRQA